VSQDNQELPRLAVVSGAIGAVIGGLLPVGLSVVGVWGYVDRGYLISRQGTPIEAGWPTWAGLAWYAIMFVGGVVLIHWGVAFYRRHRRPDAAE
jgi:hypothetical protein